MFLAIDIGNTNITFGLFKSLILKRSFNIPTRSYGVNKLSQKLGKLKIDNAVICSVVPNATRKIKKDLRALTGKQAYIIGKDIRVPMHNLYRDPKQLGQDRLINAYAASKIYSLPLVIASCGTAITLDLVSKNGEYLGGLIQPGLNLSLASLNLKTALLPKVKLSSPAGLVGRDTKSGILNGVILGAALALDGLIEQIQTRVTKTASVIATGGDARLIKKFSKHIKKLDSELTLKGISLVYNETFKKSS